MGKSLLSISFLLAIIFSLGSCKKTDEDGTSNAENNLSVEAYIYVGEPVKCIKLNKMSGLNSLTPTPVTSAYVQLWQNEQVFDFNNADSIPGNYSQAVDSLLIKADSPIYMNIISGENSYRLMANIPPKIQNLEMDETEITLNPYNPDEVLATIHWQPIDGYNYCLFIRNAGYDYYPIPAPEGSYSHSTFNSLITENSVQLKSSDFTHQGHYDIYVTAVDNAYANFYINPANIAALTELNESLPTWGVFTVFNGSSIQVHVN